MPLVPAAGDNWDCFSFIISLFCPTFSYYASQKRKEHQYILTKITEGAAKTEYTKRTLFKGLG